MNLLPRKQREIIIVAGPTAIGKSRYAVELAQHVGGEIVNADSQQVYQGCDIGTGKISEHERQGIPHHLLDIVPPSHAFDVSQFVVHADRAIAEIRARGNVPIVVGGTGLYLKSLVWGLCDAPPRDATVRAACEQVLAEQGTEALHAQLNQLDPEMALQIHPNHTSRVIRALEVVQLTGKSIATWQQEHNCEATRYDAEWIGLTCNRDTLRERISARIKQQMADGWLDEVRSLRKTFGREIPIFRAIGYRELCAMLDGAPESGAPDDATLEATINAIHIATCQYAKRQLTYLRAIKAVHWVERNSSSSP